jgi:DNA-3-methyladenine glycosylase II
MTTFPVTTFPMTAINHTEAILHLQQVDPRLAVLIAQAPDCTLGQENRAETLCLALVKSIIYQQISIKAANTVYSRFLGLYPESDFPSAEQILATPEPLLRNIGLPAKKVEALQDLAIKIRDGLPDFPELARMEDAAIIATLSQIKGIGPWSVQMLLMFQLQRWDVLPTSDLGIRAAVRDLYQLDSLPPPKKLAQIALPWQPYRTIACWYLWHSRDQGNRTTINHW